MTDIEQRARKAKIPCCEEAGRCFCPSTDDRRANDATPAAQPAPDQSALRHEIVRIIREKHRTSLDRIEDDFTIRFVDAHTGEYAAADAILAALTSNRAPAEEAIAALFKCRDVLASEDPTCKEWDDACAAAIAIVGRGPTPPSIQEER